MSLCYRRGCENDALWEIKWLDYGPDFNHEPMCDGHKRVMISAYRDVGQRPRCTVKPLVLRWQDSEVRV